MGTGGWGRARRGAGGIRGPKERLGEGKGAVGRTRGRATGRWVGAAAGGGKRRDAGGRRAGREAGTQGEAARGAGLRPASWRSSSADCGCSSERRLLGLREADLVAWSSAPGRDTGTQVGRGPRGPRAAPRLSGAPFHSARPGCLGAGSGAGEDAGCQVQGRPGRP